MSASLPLVLVRHSPRKVFRIFFTRFHTLIIIRKLNKFRKDLVQKLSQSGAEVRPLFFPFPLPHAQPDSRLFFLFLYGLGFRVYGLYWRMLEKALPHVNPFMLKPLNPYTLYPKS